MDQWIAIAAIVVPLLFAIVVLSWKWTTGLRADLSDIKRHLTTLEVYAEQAVKATERILLRLKEHDENLVRLGERISRIEGLMNVERLSRPKEPT